MNLQIHLRQNLKYENVSSNFIGEQATILFIDHITMPLVLITHALAC